MSLGFIHSDASAEFAVILTKKAVFPYVEKGLLANAIYEDIRDAVVDFVKSSGTRDENHIRQHMEGQLLRKLTSQVDNLCGALETVGPGQDAVRRQLTESIELLNESIDDLRMVADKQNNTNNKQSKEDLLGAIRKAAASPSKIGLQSPGTIPMTPQVVDIPQTPENHTFREADSVYLFEFGYPTLPATIITITPMAGSALYLIRLDSGAERAVEVDLLRPGEKREVRTPQKYSRDDRDRRDKKDKKDRRRRDRSRRRRRRRSETSSSSDRHRNRRRDRRPSSDSESNNEEDVFRVPFGYVLY